jgi:cytolysin-activating lysine-acyltransferase
LAGNGHAANGNGGSHNHSPFTNPAPEGAAKTVAAVLGEITWLMSQSKAHKSFFISDLEWLVMPPILLKHFRIFYDTGTPAEAGKPAVEGKPIGVVLWASVNDIVSARLAEGGGRMAPQDWTSGDMLWIVEVIAPFGGHDAMVADLKERVFPGREIRALVTGVDGTRKVGVV